MADPENGLQRDDPQMQSALELLGMLGPVAEQSYSRAGNVADELFSNRPTELSSEERQELNTLRDAFQELSAPQMQTRPIGSRIAGNEFSVSTAGLSQGLNQMMQGIETKRRSDALFGDPERRAKLKGEIDTRKEEVKSIRENAQKIRDGVIPAENLMRLDPMADKENVAQSVEQQAQELEDEISLYEDKLRQSEGVYSRTQEAEENAERVDQNRQAKNQFETALGGNIYSTGVQMERDRRQQQSMQIRESIRQAGVTQRTKIMQKRILDGQKLQFNKAKTDSEIEATEFTPGSLQPPFIKQVMHDSIGKVDNTISELKDKLSATLEENVMTGEKPPFSLALAANPELADQFRELQQAKRYMEMIDQAADVWQDKTFRGDRAPNWRAPSEFEEQIYFGMLDSKMIHPETVKAWLHYNEIDPSAAPKAITPPNGRRAGSYGRNQQ